jgi:hypothetical protein
VFSRHLRKILEAAEEIANKRGWFGEHNALWWTRRHLRRIVFVSGAVPWGTKSFEFWTLLMVILAVVRPKSIVELGSGRSTSYLAEYAIKQAIPFASIEQNSIYARKIKRGLKNSFLDPGYLHHVPLDQDGWYQLDELNRLVTDRCEFLFVDGPVGAQEAIGRGVRRSERSDQWLTAAAATSKVVIVDDVHRKSNLDMFKALLSRSEHLRPMYVPYYVQEIPNVVAIAILSAWYGTVAQICSQVKIDFFTDYSSDRCSEA